jgi:hypothetical protein
MEKGEERRRMHMSASRWEGRGKARKEKGKSIS